MLVRKSSIKNLQKMIHDLREKSSYKLKDVIFFLSVIFQNIILHPILNFIWLPNKNNKKERKKITVGFCGSFSGNTRALFEYMEKHPDEYDIFWATWNLSTIREVKKAGGKAFYRSIFLGGGLPYFLKADVWVISNVGENPIPFLPHEDYKIVQIFHGIGPKPKFRKKEFYKRYDKSCFPSEFSKKRQIELFNAPENKLEVTGFPRIDTLIKYLKDPRKKLLDELGIPRDKEIILYAPTWKMKGFNDWGDGLWPWENEYVQFEKLCKFCHENNLTLILRLHGQARLKKKESKKKKLESIIKKYDDVYWKDMDDERDTAKLLAVADILITDWSSIFTDYYLTQRPIIFLEEKNRREFVKKHGTSQVPLDYKVGEIVNSEDELYEVLEFVLKEGNRYKDEHKKLFEILMGKSDGKASKRVAKVIEELIEK